MLRNPEECQGMLSNAKNCCGMQKNNLLLKKAGLFQIRILIYLSSDQKFIFKWIHYHKKAF